MKEIRRILDWWAIMVLMPGGSWHDGEDPVTIDHDQKLEVKFIPTQHKVFLFTCMLLPRTLICAWLAGTGAMFLLSADDYGDLILNSVALGFLIDIDEMLYAAVASHRNRDQISRCQEIKVVKSSFIRALDRLTCQRYHTVSLTNTMAVAIASVYFVTYGYVGPHGKFALANAFRCMCHAAGDFCVEAHVLGGQIHGLTGVSESVTHPYLLW